MPYALNFCFAHTKILNQLSGEDLLSQRHVAEVHVTDAAREVVSYLQSQLESTKKQNQSREAMVSLFADALVIACICRCNNSFSAGTVLYRWPQEVLLGVVGVLDEHVRKSTARAWRAFAQEFFDGTFSSASRALACDIIDHLLQRVCAVRDIEAVEGVAHCIQALTPAMRRSLNSQNTRKTPIVSG